MTAAERAVDAAASDRSDKHLRPTERATSATQVRDSARREIAYWMCQVLGWGAYSAVFLTSAVLQVGWRTSAVAGYALFFGYSIALTHLLRRTIHQRQWIGLAPKRLFPRLALSAIILGAIQTSLVIAIYAGFERRVGEFGQPRMIFGAWIGITGVTFAWSLLYLAVVSMRRYWDARHHALQAQLAVREAELRALEAQINPHFLFNCLNSIRAMISEDPPHAQHMVTQLASLLRYGLQHDRAHTVPLAQEIENVSDYLELEAVRFEDRLRVSINVDPAAAAIEIPAMLLQTLVENALKHGIASLPAGGEVLIRAVLEGGALKLEVENSGRLTESLPGATKVGLNNARERLSILYGDRASLELTSREGGRVAAIVVIPVNA